MGYLDTIVLILILVLRLRNIPLYWVLWRVWDLECLLGVFFFGLSVVPQS